MGDKPPKRPPQQELPEDLQTPSTVVDVPVETPVVTEEEPVNPYNKARGTLVLDTTYRKKPLKGQTHPHIYWPQRKNGPGLNGARDANWGRVALITVRNIRTGVRNVTIKANGYKDRFLRTGIEKEPYHG